jgi:hypothetical protein
MNSPILRDPVGLLERSPELAELALHSAALRKAIERGSPHAAYRALFWGAYFGRRFKGAHRETARALLRHRRIFFKPLTGAPTMFTYNGFGSSLYGRADYDDHDGTYVSTLYVVFVFVPVFPIASYLVRDAANDGRRAWSFIAKVPFGALQYVWQRIIALGVLAMVASASANAFEGYRHNTVHVVNGLERPLQIELGAHLHASVPAGGEVALRTESGRQLLTVRDGDTVLESASLDVPRGRNALAWNVLGAAPVFVAKVIYGEKSGHAPPSGDPKVMCGQTQIAIDGVDYLFVEPPRSISMPKGSGTVTKTHMGVANGGLRACLGYLEQHDPTKGARLALTATKATRTPASKLPEEMSRYLANAPRAEVEVYVKDLLGRDDSVSAHRVYQDWLLTTDQRSRAVAEYDERARARQGEADADYLAVRVKPLADERRLIDALVARHPEHAYMRRAQAYVHYADREFEQVVASNEALKRIDRTLWLEGLVPYAESLVALGRGKDALAVADEVAREQAATTRRTGQLVAYRVAHRIGAPERDLPKAEHDAKELRVFVRLATGLDVTEAEISALEDERARDALRIGRAALSAPDRALASSRTANVETLRGIPDSIRVLLLGEAARQGASGDLVDKLCVDLPPPTAAAMVAYAKTGTASDLVTELPLEFRAALEFVRSRDPALPSKERAERLERAKASDVLHGPVTVAIGGWPP